ncbi:hypothetical protein SAMD00023353_1900450 [Rosellinia necatrix]|uniref:Uncharacterized protein n=1 Tax=Rosellinia necatrix TaxID=77044 RepID=A0A1S8A7F3_ROSNE|nr:hypothetical protein SAMD00023353_1900450 [Rosellinia necatrix]
MLKILQQLMVQENDVPHKKDSGIQGLGGLRGTPGLPRQRKLIGRGQNSLLLQAEYRYHDGSQWDIPIRGGNTHGRHSSTQEAYQQCQQQQRSDSS